MPPSLRSLARHAGRILLHNVLAVYGGFFLSVLVLPLTVASLLYGLESAGLRFPTVPDNWFWFKGIPVFCLLISMVLGIIPNLGYRDREACFTWVPGVLSAAIYGILKGYNPYNIDNGFGFWAIFSSAYSVGAVIALLFKRRPPRPQKHPPEYKPLW